MLVFISQLLCSTASATEHAVSFGLGGYHGGAGIAYTYSPMVGLGFQTGLGLNGVALGARWQPTWLSGGYAQAGLVRVSSDQYKPNMVVGGKWKLSGRPEFVEANGGVAISLDGQWWPVWDVAVGRQF